MAEVEIHDLRDKDGFLDGLITKADILSITRKNEGNILVRLDSGYAIEMSSSPIGQVLAALKLGNKHEEEITLVEDEALVATDIRLKKQIVTGNIINCYVSIYKDDYFIKLELDTGYSIKLILEQKWLDKI